LASRSGSQKTSPVPQFVQFWSWMTLGSVWQKTNQSHQILVWVNLERHPFLFEWFAVSATCSLFRLKTSHGLICMVLHFEISCVLECYAQFLLHFRVCRKLQFCKGICIALSVGTK
jgi:hypothetical protein